MSRKLAVIRELRIGVDDRNNVSMRFSAFTEPAHAALQVLSWEQAKEMIEAYGVADAHDLDGRTCWVECSDDMARYVEPAVM